MELILSVHKISAGLFLLIYLVKGIIIFLKNDPFKQKTFKLIKVPEMLISATFLITGLYLLFSIGEPPAYLYGKLLLVVLAIPLAVIGQKRSKPLFLWISILIIVYVFGASETGSLTFKKEKIEMLADDGSGENYELLNIGSHVYGENCLRCHGRNGDLERYGAKKLIESSLSPEKRRSIILEGKGNMPGFSKKLDQKELESLELFLDKYYSQ